MLRTVIQLGKNYKCFSKLCSSTTSNSKTIKCQLPAIVASNYGTCVNLKKCCNSRWSDENNSNRKKKKARKDKSSYQLKHDWMDALGWPYCYKRISSNPAERYAFHQLAKCSTTEYATVIQCLTKVHAFTLETTARYVVPTVNASKYPSQQENTQDHDEVLKEVCNQLDEAHSKVNSSLQNFLGTECMQQGKHEEAFLHFSDAAKSNHSSAFFNLGICCEMGFGTKQSFSKAAEFYRKAADLGHATAMYNLGVFYVHGWGSVNSDEKEAEALFLKAAELGQKDARRALNLELEDETVADSPSDANEENRYSLSDAVELQNNTLTDIWFKVMNIKLDDPKAEKSLSSDSGINEFSPSADLYFSPT